MSDALIVDLFRAIDSGEWSSLDSFFDRNVVYERPGYAPIVGVDRLLHFYRQERIVQSGRHELDGVVMENGRGACWGRFVGVAKDGSQLNEAFADTYVLADGRIIGRKSFFFKPAM